jgi:TetR/AcrR family transcriptional regulator
LISYTAYVNRNCMSTDKSLHTNRKEWEREQRRDRIVGIAEQLIIELGIENITFEEIAAASGYTRRTIYHYFRDKEELSLSVVLKALLILHDRLKHAIENPGDSLLRSLAWAYFRFFLDHPVYFDLTMRYESRTCIYYRDKSAPPLTGFKASCQQTTDTTSAMLTEAITHAMAQGSIKTTLSPKQMMLVIWGQISGIMQIILMRQNHFTETFGMCYEDLFEEFLAMVESSLAPA